MIIGLGSDLCDIRRIEQSLKKFGARFEARVFTPAEQAKARSRKGDSHRNGVASTYAKRFAAKEACSKALGTGLANGVFWKDMGVVNLPGGKPTMLLTGGAAEKLAELMPAGHEAFIHLTITDEHPYAQAFVIIEARPLAAGPVKG